MMIPVYTPLFKGNEKQYLQQAIDSGWVSSDGYFVQRFEDEFAKWADCKYAITVCNGTAALETALFAADARYYNTFIPTSTIISCLLAVQRNKSDFTFYEPVINNSTMNPIIRCHLFGKFDKSTTKGTIIDDASQYWKPFKVKDVACYSLFANKLITSGEGGVIVTNKKEIYEKAKSYRNLCHSKTRFIHNDLGYNFRMSNLQAAVALAQLEQINKFIEIKQKNRDLYKRYMPNGVKILFNVEIPWMYLVETKQNARIMVKKLYQQGVACRRFFYPLHKQPCLNKEYEHLSFPEAEHKWKYQFYLPSGLNLTQRQIGYICKKLEGLI